MYAVRNLRMSITLFGSTILMLKPARVIQLEAESYITERHSYIIELGLDPMRRLASQPSLRKAVRDLVSIEPSSQVGCSVL